MKRNFGRTFGKGILAAAMVAAVGSSMADVFDAGLTAGNHDPISLSRPVRSHGDPSIRDMPVVRR